MSTTPRNLPRFLPTLTEVVQPPGLVRTPVPATPDLEETVCFVMQRVDLVIERRISEKADAMLRALVTEQLQTISASLRQELEGVVRHAVSEAMTSRADLHKPKQ
jgi:hypothetical protein